MGWIISLALLIGCAFVDAPFSGDAILVAAGLFAVAGSIGGAASIITRKDKDKDKDAE